MAVRWPPALQRAWATLFPQSGACHVCSERETLLEQDGGVGTGCLQGDAGAVLGEVVGWAQRGAAGTGKVCPLSTWWGWGEVRWIGNNSLVQAFDFLCPVCSGKR